MRPLPRLPVAWLIAFLAIALGLFLVPAGDRYAYLIGLGVMLVALAIVGSAIRRDRIE